MTDQYPLFEHWYKTQAWIFERCDGMPKHTRFTISGRIVHLCLDTTELIIEAIYTKDRVVLLRHINLNLEKLRIFFRLCFERRYIAPSQHQFIQQEIDLAGKMCGGWQKQTA
ncbi:MAG: diversity-generating retroelement protein Avd [Saprospiraceae bacterium]